MEEKFLKVLVIGETFRSNGGGGITLMNFFKGWPSSNIAVIASEEKIRSSELGFSDNFYQLGFSEIKYRWPFNFLQKKTYSGEVSLDKIKEKSIKGRNTNFKNETLKRVLKVFKSKALEYFYFNFQLSNRLSDWIDEFNPDIVYAQVVHYETINIVNSIFKEKQIPYCLHILDDVPSVLGKENFIVRILFHNQIRKNIKRLINNASSLMSIGKKMSEEYYLRYGKTFYPFHNPIEMQRWLPCTKKDFLISSKIKILFSGRISFFNYKSLNVLITTIKKLNSEGYNITLDIFSSVNRDLIVYDENIKFHDFVSHDKLPCLIAKYDIVFLPLNFDDKTINFAQYSMPTKLSEYMISGVPILIHAPKETALYQYASEYQFAITSSNPRELELKLIKVIESENKRKELSETAVLLAKKKHNAINIRKEFNYVLRKSVNLKSF